MDLPGVRDSNAARAKVAEQYLQNRSQIWIAAPIKRAVDDGTELTGSLCEATSSGTIFPASVEKSRKRTAIFVADPSESEKESLIIFELRTAS